MIYRDLPRVEFEVWPHVVCLEWSDGWKWTVRTFNGRSGDGSFVFDGSVVPSSGAGESAVDAARRALEAIRGEEGITS